MRKRRPHRRRAAAASSKVHRLPPVRLHPAALHRRPRKPAVRRPRPPPPPPVQQLFQSLQSASQTANTTAAAQTVGFSSFQQAQGLTQGGFSTTFTLFGRSRSGRWTVGPDTFTNLPNFVNFDTSSNSRTFSGKFSSGKFTGTFGSGESFSFFVPENPAGRFFDTTVTDARFAGGSGTGQTFVAADGRFFYGNYALANNERATIFGGTPVSGAALLNSSQRVVRQYTVTADPTYNSKIPFISNLEQGGPFANPYIGQLLMVTPAASGQSGRGMQVSFAVDGSGASQRSILSVSTFNVFNDSNGNLTIGGGGRDVIGYTGDNRPARGGTSLSNELDGNGNGFFGTLTADGSPTNFVLSQNGTSTSSVREQAGGYQQQVLNGATATSLSELYYRFSSVATYSTSSVTAAPTALFLNGYVGGLRETATGASMIKQFGNDPTETVVRLLPGINSVAALLSFDRIGSGVTENFRVAFGARPTTFSGTATNFNSSVGDYKNSAFNSFTVDGARATLIDAQTWAARDTINSGAGFASDGSSNSFGAVVTSNQTTNPSSITNQGAISRVIMIPSTAIDSSTLAAAFPTAPFRSFEIMQWGFWAGQVTIPDPFIPGSRGDRYNLATWIAGALPALSDIPASGTATYNGFALATVYNNGARYNAGGGYTQTWNFGSDSGSATISNFDGRANINASLSSSNRREFTGSASGGGGLSGNITGSFFRGNSDAVKNVGGNFNVSSGSTYLASGIIAGSR